MIINMQVCQRRNVAVFNKSPDQTWQCVWRL